MEYQAHEFQNTADSFVGHGQRASVRLRRWLLFSLIFIPCLLASQIYIFMQPAIYQSVATVLTMAATDIDQASPAADVQHVNIQKQILLGTMILEKTAERLQQLRLNSKTWSADELRSLFAVIPQPETNLVQLQAEGPEPQILQLAVNAWIDSYLKVRAEFIAENTEKVVAELNEQLQRIDRQVVEKRNEIDRFRLQNNILSTESSDNQAHARLQGLNASLNKAMEEEVKAKAKFDTVLDAISRNETVVPDSDSQSMAVLVQQAEKLRDQLAAIEGQYTQDYIELNPNLRRVRDQLAEIEAKIAEKATVGKSFARQQAENDYTAARQAVIAIKQQMEAHKKLAADYTKQFAEHQALQQELLKLETLQQDTKQRLVDIDVKQRQKYPQVDVVDWATLPDKPIRPDYLQQSLLAFVVSLGLALSVVTIIDYLNREPPVPAPMNLGGIHLHHQPHPMLDLTPPQSQVAYEPAKALPVANIARALTYEEVLALYQTADPHIKLIIGLLLNGLSLSEIVSLNPDNLDSENALILVPGRRNLIMSQQVAQLLSQIGPVTSWPTLDDIETLLCCAAIDSGLRNPEQINAETLRYAYMLFLVEQGIKLTDLTKIAGSLSPGLLLELGRFSPEPAGLPLEKIDLNYFR